MGEMKTASHKKLLRSSKTAYTKIEEPKKVASPASSPSPSINCLYNYLIYHRGTILPNILRNGFSFSKKNCFTIEAETEAILGGEKTLPNKLFISKISESFF